MFKKAGILWKCIVLIALIGTGGCLDGDFTVGDINSPLVVFPPGFLDGGDDDD